MSELSQELREKDRRIYHLWKKGQVTQEVYKDVVRSCRNKTRKAKISLKFNLVAIGYTSFKKYINSKRAKVKFHSLLDKEGNTVTKDEGKAEVLFAFFASFFSSKTSYAQSNWPPDLVGRDREQQKRAPVIHEEVISDCCVT